MRTVNILQNISKLFTYIESKLRFLGIGSWNDNICDTNNMLLVGPKYNNGYQLVIVQNAAEELINKPAALNYEGKAVLYRQVIAQTDKEEAVSYAMVVLREIYPYPDRVWINIYDRIDSSIGGWNGWKDVSHVPMGTASATDLNAEGFRARTSAYWINPSTTTSNIPSSTYGVLENVKGNAALDGAQVQRFTQYNSANAWQRVFINSQWYPWFYVGGANFSVSTFTSGSITGNAGSTGSVEISYTIPDGYEYVCYLNTRTNGSVQMSYPESVNTSTKKIRCFWRSFTASATFTISVMVLFHRIR